MAYPAPASLPPRPAMLPDRAPSAPALRPVVDDAFRAGGRDFLGRAAQAGLDLTAPLQAGALRVDLDGYVVTVGEEVVDLSPRQVELLALFLAAPRKVWSRDQLHSVCWGDTAPSRRVDVQLCRLRAKTGIDLFRNVRDRGWALRPVA